MVRIYSIATVDAPAKPIWHHKSVIAPFQIALQLLTDLLALTALAFRLFNWRDALVAVRPETMIRWH